MKKPKVTFMMLAYNTANHVRKAVESILNQTDPDINLLVRNNGSTDATGDILRDISKNDSRVILFENSKNWIDENGDFFTSDGILRVWPLRDETLLGEYISIVDSDDWLEPDFVEKMYAAAKDVNAEIAVCGHTFMLDGELLSGKRLPPALKTDNMLSESNFIRDNFSQLYNSFRTWWGKLFRTDFFLEHYNDAWRTNGGNYGSMLDTVHMLRYLDKCRRFAALDTSLYNFRIHSGSTYAKKYPIYSCPMEAESLYMAGRQILVTFSARSPQNEAFLFQLHWSYLIEAAQGLTVSHIHSYPRRDLSWLAAILNNPIVAMFYGGNEEVVLGNAKLFADTVYKRSGKDLSLYTSYIMRIKYVTDELESNPGNLLLFPILAGCLYDRENKIKIGREFLDSVAVSPEFEPSFRRFYFISNWESRLDTQCPNLSWLTPYDYDGSEEVKSLENDLFDATQKEDYTLVCELLEKLLVKNPLSRNAMYHRIRMSMVIEDFELAAVLAGTAMALWPMDIDMQSLCWDVIAAVSKEESIPE